jgi:uncharacterized protein with HEPN domain
MPLDERDAALLWDMLAACHAIQRFLSGRSFEQYLADEVLQSAVERKIQIIGEAATKISGAVLQEHPEVPWKLISGQRHVLAHDYGRIEHDRIWNVASVHLAVLAGQLSCILPAES